MATEVVKISAEDCKDFPAERGGAGPGVYGIERAGGEDRGGGLGAVNH